jgi:hypothetical protein
VTFSGSSKNYVPTEINLRAYIHADNSPRTLPDM